MRALVPLLLVSLIGLGGCALPGAGRDVLIVKEPADPVTAVDGLRQWWVADASGALYVKPPHPGLDRYRAYLIESPKLHFRRLSAKPSRNDAARLSTHMANVIRRRLESAFGWSEADAPGPEVVRVRAQVSHIEFSSPDTSSHTRTTALVSRGSMVYFMLELQDSETSDPLVRYGVRRPLPGGTFTGPSWHELDRARLVFRHFGNDIIPNLQSLAQN